MTSQESNRVEQRPSPAIRVRRYKLGGSDEIVIPCTQPITVRYTETEQAVITATEALADSLEQAGITLRAKTLRSLARSSTYALERSLRELRNRAAHRMAIEDIDPEAEAQPATPIRLPAEAIEQTTRILGLLDEVRVDSKAESLLELLRARLEPVAERPIVVVSQFSATVEYVASFLADRGMPTRSLTGELDPNDAIPVINSLDRPGVTVLTLASLRGLEFHAATRVIAYEPLDPYARLMVTARFRARGPGPLVELLQFTN